MTDKTQTIEELKTEVAELKAAKIEELKAQAEQRTQDMEIAELQNQLNSLKAGKLPGAGTPSGVPVSDITMQDCRVAAIRQGLCGFAHFMGGPVASIYYGSKTGYWMPTICATGIAAIGVPFMLLDFGFTVLIGAPATSAVLLINASNEKRRKLGITLPEQAEHKMAQFRAF